MPTGLDFAKMTLAGTAPDAPIGKHVNMTLLAVEEGYAKYKGIADASHFNPMGSVHGGYAATLLDSACGIATLTTIPEGKAFTTIDLAIKYLRPVPTGVELICEGRVQKTGRKVIFTEASLFGPDGKLLAHATSSLAVIDLPPQMQKG